MGIWFWIVIFAVGGIAIAITQISQEAEAQEAGRAKGTLVEYLGGSPHMNVASNARLKTHEDGLLFFYEGGSGYIETPWNNIESVEFKTHEQLTKDVTAGRFFSWGYSL
ncbi:MAG: hypothetical protein ABRQ24_00595 [Syntrophomonadaceae bacterium]